MVFGFGKFGNLINELTEGQLGLVLVI